MTMWVFHISFNLVFLWSLSERTSVSFWDSFKYPSFVVFKLWSKDYGVGAAKSKLEARRCVLKI